MNTITNIADINTVDSVTRARCGSLAARGLSERQVADILLLSIEQVMAVKASIEYKESYAKIADEIIQQQINLEEGWNIIEEEALKIIMKTLEFNRDPRYALQTAAVANKATRRVQRDKPHVIDATQANNIVVLNFNKTYITEAQKSEHSSVIDITPDKIKEIPRRRSDVPNPQDLERLLGQVKENIDPLMNELEGAFEIDNSVLIEKNNG